MRTPSARLSFMLLTALLPIACSPGGSSGGPATVGALQSGQLIEPVVGGLPYTTPTLAGVTESDGTFRYRAGEKVTFALGGTPIGRPTKGTAQLRLLELVPGATLPVKVAELARFRQEGSMTQPAADLLDSFEAVNVLVLIDALDADKESANGITLAPNLDAVLATTQLDLRQPSFRFQRGFPLREAVYRAFDAGRIPDARIRDPWPVLDRQLDLLGIVPQAWITAHAETDWNNDLDIDSISDTLLDARGFPIVASFDYDGDGTLDAAETREIDDDGRLLTTAFDWDGDRHVDNSSLRIYDVHGRIERYESDNDGDFVADLVTSYEYDALGNLVRTLSDFDADGIPETVEVRQYDSGGRLTRIERDLDGDGLIDRTSSTLYDAKGFSIEASNDDDADGIPDTIQRYQRDAHGNPLREESDHDADGEVDLIRELVWDDHGNVVVESWDYDADGRADDRVEREYDARHRAVRYRMDRGNDGVIDEVDTYRYVDDSEGREIERSDDYGDDGTTNYGFKQSWGAEGQRLTTLWDTNGDGLVDGTATELQQQTTLLGLTVGD